MAECIDISTDIGMITIHARGSLDGSDPVCVRECPDWGLVDDPIYGLNIIVPGNNILEHKHTLETAIGPIHGMA